MPWTAITALCEQSGHAYRTLSARAKKLAVEEKVGPTVGGKKVRLLRHEDLFILRDVDTSAGELSPSDRRNMAQADKLETETAILRREWIPVDEAAEIVGVALDHVQKQIEASELPPATRTALIEKLQDLKME